MASGGPAVQWAVWRAWRGDRAKLARIARAMESCYPAGDFVRARVDVRVRGDNESYGNVTRFAREASSQTTDELDSLTLATDGGQGRIEVALSRRSPRGVIVTVEPSVGSPPVWAADALDTVDRAVSRGRRAAPGREHGVRDSAPSRGRSGKQGGVRGPW